MKHSLNTYFYVSKFPLKEVDGGKFKLTPLVLFLASRALSHPAKIATSVYVNFLYHFLIFTPFVFISVAQLKLTICIMDGAFESEELFSSRTALDDDSHI